MQLGYLTAERCGWIGGMIAEGREIRAVFQRKGRFGAYIRAAFDGEDLTLPAESLETGEADDPEFWPDPIWPDE